MTNVANPTGSEGTLLGPSPPPSFASLFKTYNPKPVDLTPATYRSFKKDGKLAISFSKQDIERGQTLLATFAVVLKFSSQRPSLSDIRGSITRDWNIMGEFTMGIIDYRHILVRFEAESEVTKALSQQNPNCLGIRFKVFRWFSGFNCKKDPALAPVWVVLPDLPLDLFHPAILESIGQNIGKFLKRNKALGPKEHPQPEVQQSKSTTLQNTSWRQAKIKQFYRPTGRLVEQFQEGETSGAKDCNGNEIQIAPATLPPQNTQQVQPASSTQPPHESAPPQAGVTSGNPFSVLEDLEEDTVHISASNDQLPARENTSLLEPGISRLDGQFTTCIEEEAKKDETAFIPALAQLYPPEPSDQFQGIAEHLQYELSVKAPLLLTNGDTDPEEEKDIEENQALVAYGSDSEVICKSKKSHPPLTMITRMKATWNILTSPSLWSTFMRNKYIQGKTVRNIALTSKASKTWRDCWRCIQEVIDLSSWDYGPGQFSVTHENWRRTEDSYGRLSTIQIQKHNRQKNMDGVCGW
ncbi:hypothetical protein FRX31_004439 [Thalictrum thalictroides]|uniref:DUF4283 domain-containing protein n=1 Tax=Thalictrum thalictroides TaxID=46969 RepID=A0A7J6X959_THATH|nr:hypothetical protein FRX31_004439 [Thalictrum thalictroides]